MEIKDELQKVVETMDVKRTSDMFDSVIQKSSLKDDKAFDENSLKETKAIIQAGNMHVRTAQVAVGAIRLVGHYDNQTKLKAAIEKKTREAMKDAAGATT